MRSRKIFRRLEMYIIYRMASSVLILGFFFFAILIFDFEIPTWILVLISMLNDASVVVTSYDAVRRVCACVLISMLNDASVIATSYDAVRCLVCVYICACVRACVLISMLNDVPSLPLPATRYVMCVCRCVCVCVCVCVCGCVGDLEACMSVQHARGVMLMVLTIVVQHTHTHTHTRVYAPQVHSADFPLHWNMTKDLSIAFAIAIVGE